MKHPFVIAEISANHNGSLNHAKKLIKLAKTQDASAIKLQTYKPETMTINSNSKRYKINKGLWRGESIWSLYKKAQTPWDWHKELFLYAKRLNITIFSTPFDTTSVDFLEKLKCPIYKVSSFEMTDLNLIKKIARTKKPMIISTGLASLKEIERTFKHAKKNGAKNISLLYCVSNYPANNSDFSLNNINILKKKFKCTVGLSDHSQDNKIAIGACAIGAKIFEKHIALKNQKKGFDLNFSIKGNEIGNYVKDINDTYKLIQKKKFFRSTKEIKNKFFRRSVYAIKDIAKGEFFTEKNIKTLRPALGLGAEYYEDLIGKKNPHKLKMNSPINNKIFNLKKK